MTKHWWNTTEPLYRRFSGRGRDAREADEMFRHETFGNPVSASNRYLAGKRTLDITAAMWRQDIQCGLLLKCELIGDKTFWGVSWWMKRILSTVIGGTHALLRRTA